MVACRGPDINYQRSENVLATALGYITRCHSFWDPRVLMHPLRPFIQSYYGHVMNKVLRKELDQRFLKIQEETSQSRAERHLKHSGGKSVVTLAIEAYMAENKESDLVQRPKLEKHFAQYATYQIRLFLFAGNDTTSSTIVYVYHLLSQHPEALEKVRQEHHNVFGTDIDNAAGMLVHSPALLNQCRYTQAVIKETLRLYPPAATMRAGRQGVTINDRHGKLYPMDYVGATILHPAVHRNPRLWPQPDKFLPDRFLVEQGHELFVYPPAFRPFEQGPRNCIGQTLVWNEIQIALILTLRTFDIAPAYDEWDAMQKMGMMGALKAKFFGEPVKTVHGDRAYQTEKAGTHPADGYPCRVTMSQWSP
jgi:cytochrome P450